MSLFSRLGRRPFFIRLFNWEYWSFGMVYTWIYPVWLLLALRARSLFFFSAANPSIRNGGFLGESKKDIHALLPAGTYPPTIHFDAHTPQEEVLQTLRKNQFNYPLVGKPDMGGRGRGVKVLRSDEDVIAYIKVCDVDFHIQKFVDYPKEAGIFYHRFPHEPVGRITGIVRKEFLSVTGNGLSTISELLQKDKRAILQKKNLEEMYGSGLNEILPEGETKLLVPYGNHARGSMFLDDTHLADAQLTKVINEFCRNIPGFYFGRLDVRYSTIEELKEGEKFSVIEVNGAGSEPTHMYDPRHSLFFAWKEIIRHWYILWKISRENKRRGHRYLTWKEGMQMFRDDKMNSKKIERMPL